MRRQLFAFCLTLFLAAATANAATVTGTLLTVTGSTRDTDIAFEPMDIPVASGISTIVWPAARTRSTDGVFTISLNQGNYRVRIDGVAVGFIRVPTGSSTYNINDIWGCFVYLPDCLEFPETANTAWIYAVGANTNASWSPLSGYITAGDNISLTTNESGGLVITGEGGGITVAAGSNITLSTNGTVVTISASTQIVNNATAGFLTYWDGNSLEDSPLFRYAADRLSFAGQTNKTFLTLGSNDAIGLGVRALDTSNLQTDTIAIGGRAMGDSPSTADYNVAVGHSAGRYLRGHDTVVIGRNAAANPNSLTNSWNVLIGADIGQAAVTENAATNSVSIGFAALNHGSNTATIGNAAVTTLYLGDAQVYPPGNDLTALEALSGTGLLARTASDTYALRAITAGSANLQITDGNGVSGNPTVDLASSLSLSGGLSVGGSVGETTVLTNGAAYLNLSAGMTKIDADKNLTNAVAGTDYLAPSAIDDTAYDATSWNGDTTHAPSKNAVRDKIEALSLGGAPSGTVVNSGTPVDTAIPIYSGTTGTNITPSSVTVGSLTNLTVPGTGQILRLGLSAAADASAHLNLNGALLFGAANALELRNGTTAQTVYISGTYTDASNYRRGKITDSTLGVLDIASEGLGTGATGNKIRFLADGAAIADYAVTTANRWTFTSSSGVSATDFFSTGANGFQAAAAGYFWWAGRSSIRSLSDGTIVMRNLADNDFNRLQFGGTSSSFPSLKRSSATLVARLADDSADARFTANDYTMSKTITAAATTGDQTINKASGSVNFAAAAQTITVTCSLVDANSVIMATVATDDATAFACKAIPGSGSFVLKLNAAATAETRVNFLITN